MKGNKMEYHIFGRTFQISPKDQIATAAKLILWAKDVIGQGVQVFPQASIAWAGVCIILPLLTNPSDADAANRDGFAEVTTRMQYYAALEPLLLELVDDSSISKTAIDLSEVCKSRIVALYQRVLDFQFQSVLRFYRNWFSKLGGDMVGYVDWKNMLLEIKSSEDAVYAELIQINELSARKKLQSLNEKSENAIKELQSLNEKSQNSLQSLKDILSSISRLVQLTENILGVQSDHLRLAEREKQHQDELAMQKCHQVFRITHGVKDDSYEWYKNRVEARVEGTCNWFLTHDNFQSWLKQDSGPLLVSADPGCGKSVLAKCLVDHGLPRSATICYFFFKDQDQNTLPQALCALIHQLFCRKANLIQYAMPEYKKNADSIRTLTNTLWTILTGAARDPVAGSTIFVLDALDECAERDFQDLTRLLRNFFRQEPNKVGRVKFLLTCRPYENIVSEFDDLVDSFPSIRIPGEDESDAISQEVNSVIKYRVQKLRFSPAIKGHLEQRLMEIPHRTYLWVYLVFDYLKTPSFSKTKKGVESAIATLPKSVNQAYEKILGKHADSEIVNKARKALSIILAAAQPLSLAEMNIAVNTDISMGSMEDLDLERENDFATHLRSWCGLFVSIYHGKVYFLHQTAREFLIASLASSINAVPSSTWQHSIPIRQAHAVLAEVCVVYLNFLNCEPALTAADLEGGHYKIKYAFLDYSAINWDTHFREGGINDDSDIIRIALSICNTSSRSFPCWYQIYCGAPSHSYHPKGASLTDLIFTSYAGLPALVKVLLTTACDINAMDATLRTALSWAARGGHEAPVAQLLAKGADVNTAKDNDGLTSLIHAAQLDRSATMEILLAHGADIEAKTSTTA